VYRSKRLYFEINTHSGQDFLYKIFKRPLNLIDGVRLVTSWCPLGGLFGDNLSLTEQSDGRSRDTHELGLNKAIVEPRAKAPHDCFNQNSKTTPKRHPKGHQLVANRAPPLKCQFKAFLY